MKFDFDLAWRILPSLLEGTIVTILLVPPILILGMMISVPIALAGLSPSALLPAGLAWAFTVFFRGTPALILMYMVYNGLPTLAFVRETFLWGFFSSAYNCAVVGLALSHAGYLVVVLRGAFKAVPPSLLDAATALGLSKPKRFFLVTAPLATRLGLSSYLNEVVILVKTTALVSAVTVIDLLGAANQAVTTTYDPFTPLVMAAVIYWIIVQFLLFGFRKFETHLNRYMSLDM